eukprot:scaffold36983_cov67-Phaeocystis_antarctica.AAC.6
MQLGPIVLERCRAHTHRTQPAQAPSPGRACCLRRCFPWTVSASTARHRTNRLPAAVVASRAATAAARRGLVFHIVAVAIQRCGTRNWVIVVVRAGAVLGDAILFRIRNVVSERRRGDGSSIARGPSDRGKLSESQLGAGTTNADGAATPGGSVRDFVVLELRGVHANIAARDQQSTAALRLVALKRGVVHGEGAAAHFDRTAQQALEDGFRDRDLPIRDQQRPRLRAGLKPSPPIRACAAKATACNPGRTTLDQNLPVELQPLKLYRGCAGANL